jgi:4-amino-4-deoxy-L-arabinose transferase-like glycosyltransferase
MSPIRRYNPLRLKDYSVTKDSDVRRKRPPRWMVLGIMLYFWWAGVAGLDRVPLVHEDEPWIAAPGYDFWETGHFGAQIFAGFYGMEQHYYTFPPLFSITEGAALQAFGMGLFQARIVPLVCMMLTLALTYRLGTRLFSEWHGLITTALLAGWRLGGPITAVVTGIPLGDVGRIARYDAAVPVFGLCAAWLMASAMCQPTRWKFFGAGVCAGLAMLCHLYGGFWLAVLLLVAVVNFRRQFVGNEDGHMRACHRQAPTRPTTTLSRLFTKRFRSIRDRINTASLSRVQVIAAILLGFGVTLTPWLVFIASGWDDFVVQNRHNSTPFKPGNGQLFIDNILNEGQRYQPILDTAQAGWGAKVGLALLVMGLVWLITKAIRNGDRSARTLLLITSVLVALFAVVSPIKTFNYLATVWPFFGLIAAAGWIWLWQFSKTHTAKRLLTVLFTLMLIEGGIRIVKVQNVAEKVTSYRAYTEEIVLHLPPNSKVIGLQNYWFGLAEHVQDYRSLLTFIHWTNPEFAAQPITFSEAARTFQANILLIDQHMLDFLQEGSRAESDMHYLVVQIDEYLRARHARLIGNLWNTTYGRCLIYELDSPDAG